jgi:predicted house-cleaning noncanonical NTP pyrophosphatase (MazG superfamily)
VTQVAASKIIRDGLVSRIPADQIRPVTSLPEHLAFMGAKFVEERDELAAADYQDTAEYADMLQVLMDTAALAGVSWPAVEAARLAKLQERGGFLGGSIYTPPVHSS